MKILSSVKHKLFSVMLVLGLMTTPVALISGTVSAAPSCTGSECMTKGAGTSGLGGGVTVEGTIKNVTNILLFLIGAVSVIMLIMGGFKYVTSNGNADQIKSAKNTILYAVVGLVVAILAYAIVDFVVDSMTGSAEPTESQQRR